MVRLCAAQGRIGADRGEGRQVDDMARRRWGDRVITWGTGGIVAGVAGELGAHPVKAVAFGLLGAVLAAAVVTYGGRPVRWYREHTAAVGLGALVAIYVVFAAVLAWIRWGA
jgi:hypothetical protein